MIEGLGFEYLFVVQTKLHRLKDVSLMLRSKISRISWAVSVILFLI